MDNLKLYTKKERGLESLVQTIQIFSDDKCMEFDVGKVLYWFQKQEKNYFARLRGNESCNYLEILQNDQFWHIEMK